MEEKLRKVPEMFKTNGYTYDLIKRVDGVVLYSQKWKGRLDGYEVHKVRVCPPRNCKFRNPKGGVKVVKLPLREILACNEDFGYYGWSFQHLKNAQVKFDELVKMEVI